jgi:hypothetical protein
MKFKSIKILSVLLALGFTGSASAIGQQGDSRIQVNGSFILADEGDDALEEVTIKDSASSLENDVESSEL